METRQNDLSNSKRLKSHEEAVSWEDGRKVGTQTLHVWKAIMEPRYDGYYISELQRSEEWHAGVRMVSEYHQYLKLFKNGLWLSKNYPTPGLDFSTYLSTVTEQAIQAGLGGRDPHDSEYEFLHRIGRY